jgi:hypothetical protein
MKEDELRKLLVKTAQIVDTSDVKELYKPTAFKLAFSVLQDENEDLPRQSPFKKSLRKSTLSRNPKTAKTKRTTGSGLVEAIRSLKEDEFFASYRNPAEVEQELRKRAINYKRSTISMALFRLTGTQDNKLFIREGAGTSKDPWRYRSKE